MTNVPFTPDQLAEGVYRALKARDMEAVADFLRVLAMVDPARAQDARDAIAEGSL